MKTESVGDAFYATLKRQGMLRCATCGDYMPANHEHTEPVTRPRHVHRGRCRPGRPCWEEPKE